jgi:phage-related protein
MAFDAGTIIARLDLDDSEFNRKLREDQARAKRTENVQSKVQLGISPQQASQFRRQMETLDRQITQDAIRRGNSGQGSLMATLLGMSSPSAGRAQATQQASAQKSFLSRLVGGSGGGGTSGGGGGSNQGWGSGLFKGIGPGILGLGLRSSLIAGGIGTAGALLPTLAAGGGALGVAGIGAGFIGAGAKELIGTKKQPGQLYDPAQAALKQLQATVKSAAQPLVAPLQQVFHQLPILLQAIGPALKQAFAGAATLILPIVHGLSYLAVSVLPLLGKAFRAAAPLIEPLIVGIGHLLTGLLPGLISLLHAARPAISAIASVLGTLGKGLGGFLSAMAPAVRASAVVFRAVGGVISALLPIIGKLAGIFAQALAPVITDLAKVLKALTPTLLIVGRVFASLAGAILKDLVAAFGALAMIIVGISPALGAFAKAFSQVFNVLENSGVFAILGDTLEKLAAPLARLISALLRGLTPLLPPLIKFVSQLASMLVNGLAQAITTLLPPLSRLAMAVLQALATVLPVVLPLFLQLASIFTGAVVRAVADLATALAAVINAIPPTVLRDAVIALLAIVGAIKAWAIAQAVLNIALDANPIGLITLAVAALVIGIVELVTHWKRVWGDIKQWASDAWNFIYHGFGKFLLPLLGPAGLIALGAIELAQHWHTIWNGIMGVVRTVMGFFSSAWHSIESTIKTVWDAIASFFTSFWNREVSGWRNIVGTISSVLRNGWNAIFTTIKSVWGSIVSFFAGIPGKIIRALTGLGTSLYNFAHSAMSKFLNGAKAVWNSVFSFFSGLPSKILHALGIHSPPDWAISAGRHVMEGILKGLGLGSGGIGGFFSKLVGNVGAGVNRWAPLVLKALRMEGLPASLLRQVLFQISTESGGNPNAQNNTDINAQRGDPSRGLLQTIGSTFAAYHWPGTSRNIFDPLANIAAAINYARHTYGPSLMSGGQGLGSGHGYDAGGWLMPGLSYNMTGQPEAVLNPSQSRAFMALAESLAGAGGPGTSTLEYKLDRLIAAVENSAGRTGVAMGAVLQGTARGATARAYYRPGAR